MTPPQSHQCGLNVTSGKKRITDGVHHNSLSWYLGQCPKLWMPFVSEKHSPTPRVPRQQDKYHSQENNKTNINNASKVVRRISTWNTKIIFAILVIRAVPGFLTKSQIDSKFIFCLEINLTHTRSVCTLIPFKWLPSFFELNKRSGCKFKYFELNKLKIMCTYLVDALWWWLHYFLMLAPVFW